ncbi:hypothetical protein BDV95DRAFT_42144 [Massariosphaeria phaeospora]|uniref:Uncharacterized protein n=1 Tax=Massariosphaeria phaeospora TaxID=100035 RepID=A0A7C8MER2_9PLEO|nr:hypothetical protein BDV95DRAFT_42144 [Massariosphaeria phaeospora]
MVLGPNKSKQHWKNMGTMSNSSMNDPKETEREPQAWIGIVTVLLQIEYALNSHGFAHLEQVHRKQGNRHDPLQRERALTPALTGKTPDSTSSLLVYYILKYQVLR